MDQENVLSFRPKQAPEIQSRHYLVNGLKRSEEISQELGLEIRRALEKIESRQDMGEIEFMMKLRLDLIDQVANLKTNEVRRSYYSHQISLTHSMPELLELVQELNQKQLNDREMMVSQELSFAERIDLESQGILSLMAYDQSFKWIQHSVTHL